MYFAYGWPKTLAVKGGIDHEDVVHLCLSDDHLVVVSTTCIQLWSGGQHRVRLGVLRRDAAVGEHGWAEQACGLVQQQASARRIGKILALWLPLVVPPMSMQLAMPHLQYRNALQSASIVVCSSTSKALASICIMRTCTSCG